MRHHLHYVFPDVESARRTLDDLLLARIESRHIHFMREGGLPDDMPEANLLHKTDIVNGCERGMAAGAALGVLLGVFIVWYFDIGAASLRAMAVVAAALVGLLFGGWAASLVAAALPNARLKNFQDDLQQGRVLLILDVPARRVEEIERLLAQAHPETRFRGEDPRVPVFP
jgi:hypothetical protein